MTVFAFILACIGLAMGICNGIINARLLIQQRRELRRRHWRPSSTDVASSLKSREVYEERW